MNNSQMHSKAETLAEALDGMSRDGQITVLVEALKLAATDERKACIRDLFECVQCTARQRDVVTCCQIVLRDRDRTNVPSPVCVRRFRKERKAKMGVL